MHAHGLKVSYEKTTLYRVGSLQNTNAEYYTTKQIKWSNETMKSLGIYIDCAGKCTDENYTEILKKVDKVCSTWINRSLTLIGKVQIVNTLIASLFIYKMFVMLNLTKEQVKIVETKITNFIWNGKRPKIAKSTLQCNYHEGGQRLVDLVARQKSLKISWIFRELDEFLDHQMYQSLDRTLGTDIWKCNLNVKDAKKRYGYQGFWSQIICDWAELNYEVPTSKNEIMENFLWLNSCIKIGGDMVVWGNWYHNGIKYVKDLFEENGEAKNAEMLGVDKMHLNSMISAIPKDWKTLLRTGVREDQHVVKLYERLTKNPKTATKIIYNSFIAKKVNLTKYIERLEKQGFTFDYEMYSKSFLNLRGLTKVTKLRDFQYRLLLGKIILNVDLFDWNISPTDQCSFCEEEEENIKHLFIDCKYVKPLWGYVENICDKNGIVVNMSTENKILSRIYEQALHIVNYISIVLKQYVYRCRCSADQPNVWVVKRLVEEKYMIETAIARRENSVNKCKKRWGPVCI